MGDEEVRVRRPWIDGEALLLADALDVFAVEDFEGESETAVEFGFPLIEHRRWAGNDDVLDSLAKEEFGRDQAGFDGFSQTDIVCDEQIYPGKAERLVERLKLIGIELDACAERRLKETGIRGGDAVPAERVEEGGEEFAGIESLATNGVPSLLCNDFGTEFSFPQD